MLCPSPCSSTSPSSAATHLLPCPFITFQLRALEKAATAPCFLAAVLQREHWAQRPEFLYEGGEGRAGGAAVLSSHPLCMAAQPPAAPQRVPVPLENAAALGWVPFGRAERNYGRARGWAAADDVCRGEKKGNQHTPGEGKGGGLLLSFLCPVARPIKGIYCSPTHRWAAEEVCDSIHIPGQPAWGRSKTGKFSSPRQSCRHGAG